MELSYLGRYVSYELAAIEICCFRKVRSLLMHLRSRISHIGVTRGSDKDQDWLEVVKIFLHLCQPPNTRLAGQTGINYELNQPTVPQEANVPERSSSL